MQRLSTTEGHQPAPTDDKWLIRPVGKSVRKFREMGQMALFAVPTNHRPPAEPTIKTGLFVKIILQVTINRELSINQTTIVIPGLGRPHQVLTIQVIQNQEVLLQ